MTSIHMDIDTCQAARGKILEIRSALLDSFEALQQKVDLTLDGSWSAASAGDFEQAYAALGPALKRKLDELSEFAEQLGQEIEAARQIDSRLG